MSAPSESSFVDAIPISFRSCCRHCSVRLLSLSFTYAQLTALVASDADSFPFLLESCVCLFHLLSTYCLSFSKVPKE